MTHIQENLNLLIDIIADDIKSSYIISRVTEIESEYIPFENELIEDTDPIFVKKLKLLLSLRYNLDLNFVTTETELQKFFDTHIARPDTNVLVRTILDWLNTFIALIGVETWNSIADELINVLTFNSKINIDKKRSCYNDYILEGGAIFAEYANSFIYNNPWVVLAGLIKFIPSSIILSLTEPDKTE